MAGSAEPAYVERTELAWTRTALALLAGTAVVARLAAGRAAPLAVATAALGIPAAAWLLAAAGRRGRRDPVGMPARPLSDGRLPFGVAALTALLGVAEICAALLR